MPRVGASILPGVGSPAPVIPSHRSSHRHSGCRGGAQTPGASTLTLTELNKGTKSTLIENGR
jgi:hypothetical protein